MIIDQPGVAPAEKPAPKGEKVRGMNASLTEAPGSGGLRERDPSRIHVTRRQIALAMVLAVLAVIAAIFTVSAVSSGASTYPAVVTTSKTYNLNFPANGQVSAILVKVGQSLKAGQVVARQDTSAMENQLKSAQGVVAADQAALSQAQNPQLSPAQREQNQLEVQQAQTALSNARANLATAQAQGHAAVVGAQSAVTSAEQLASSDQARYNQACPTGPVPPTPNMTEPQFQAAEALYTHCQDLQQQLDKDLQAVSQAQAQLPVAQAQAESSINQAQATVNSAQSALNVAQFQLTLQTSSNNPTAVADAQATLNKDQGQLQQLEASVQRATLVAPDNCVVAALYGAVGEYLGPAGVQQYAAPNGLPPSQSSGIQLFPTATTPQNQSGNGSQVEPLAECIGGQQQVEVQVPESHVSGFQAGRTVHVNVPALHTTVDGKVSEVLLTAAKGNSSPQYEVFVNLQGAPLAGLLPGMTANVRT